MISGIILLLILIPLISTNAYSEQCSDGKLCLENGDFFETITYHKYFDEGSDLAPYDQIMYKSGGTTDDKELRKLLYEIQDDRSGLNEAIMKRIIFYISQNIV